jgi:hypothetical protein
VRMCDGKEWHICQVSNPGRPPAANHCTLLSKIFQAYFIELNGRMINLKKKWQKSRRGLIEVFPVTSMRYTSRLGMLLLLASCNEFAGQPMRPPADGCAYDEAA